MAALVRGVMPWRRCSLLAPACVPAPRFRSTFFGDFLREETDLPWWLKYKVPSVARPKGRWKRGREEEEKKEKKKSWKERHEKYLHPFLLDVYVSKKYVTAKVVHRVTSRVVSVATTSARDLRLSLPSLVDEEACRLIAERSMEMDVFAVAFRLKKGQKYEGKLAVVVDAMVDEGGVLLL